MHKKALVLVSGGLDSSVALGLMQRQQIKLEAVSFCSFVSDGLKEGTMGIWARRAADHFGVPIHFKMLKEEFVEMVRKPAHGYGVGINPCIDCKILMLRTAKEMLAARGASFVVTGEVIGERPMSQNKNALRIVERDSGLEGLLVRPLSGKLLPATEPERQGILDRDKLATINGRSREGQIKLAEEFGLTRYPQPAGGCILTQRDFSHRMKDLFIHGYGSFLDVMALRWGRHFRITPDIKAIIGRDERENTVLFNLASADDYIFTLTQMTGPLLVLKGALTDEIALRAAGLVKYYSRARSEERAEVAYCKKGEHAAQRMVTESLSFEKIAAMYITNK